MIVVVIVMRTLIPKIHIVESVCGDIFLVEL